MQFFKYLRYIIIALTASAIFSSAHSQTDQVLLNLELVNPTAQVFQIGDLNFINSAINDIYFFIEMQNFFSDSRRIYLDLRFCKGDDVIAQTQSNEFDLPPGINYRFSSQQFVTGTALIPENGQLIDIDFDDDNVDLDAVEDLESDILATGVAPTGVYRFKLSAIDVSTGTNYNDNQEGDHELIITNPTTIELLFPGSSVSDNNIEEVATTFPFFQLFSDVNPGFASYNVWVYEKFPEDQTVQDVLSHPAMFEVQGLSQNFFQYPTSSDDISLLAGTVQGPIRPLEAGKTYYWQAESVVETLTGDLVLQSDVFRFRIVDLNQVANSSPQIIAFLQQILGTNYEAVLQQLQEKGFEPNGTLTLNGSTIDVNQLLQVLTQVLQGNMVVEGAETFQISN